MPPYALYLAIALISLAPMATCAEPLVLQVRHAPASGLVIAHATPGPELAGAPGLWQGTLPNGETIPVQFVPDAGGGGGAFVLQLPVPANVDVALTPRAGQAPRDVTAPETFAMGQYSLHFDPDQMGGMPSAIKFTASHLSFEKFSWNDRVYDPGTGGYSLRFDRSPRVRVVSDGPVCTVVRVHARYCSEGGQQPASRPVATYDWYLFRNQPVVRVTASLTQKSSFSWSELHLLELNFPGADFTHYAGGNPAQDGDLTASQKSYRFTDWAVVEKGRNGIGAFGAPAIVYDGRGGYGSYLHSTWTSWNATAIQLSAWLWIGTANNPAAQVQAAASQWTPEARSVVTTPELLQEIAALAARTGKQSGEQRTHNLWLAGLAEALEGQGRLKEARQMTTGKLPEGWTLHRSGDLGMGLAHTASGIQLVSLRDMGIDQELLAPQPTALFTIELRKGDEQAQIAADAGWQSVNVNSSGANVRLTWSRPVDTRLAGLQVLAEATAQSKENAWLWRLQVTNSGSPWGVWRVAFPRISLRDPGHGTLLYPQGCGIARQDAWDAPFTYRGAYPSGWCSMQFMAAYGGARPTGLLFAMEDPYGSTKDFAIDTDPAAGSLQMACDIPAPNMGKAGNGFELCGDASWRLLHGDWFDAARMYRQWAERHAKWWPQLTADGRPDTPLWMRELCAWVQTGGAPADCVGPVSKMAAWLGTPLGFHWYNWHHNPFDNDYPHYFPTKPGVPEAVHELQKAGVRVMPYINGRLWDTRDDGLKDAHFTSEALPSATKDPQGKPIIETYGSKESDGSPVRLAVMCPTTALWQTTIRDIVLRLMREVGVDGVYIDQIAAAAPALCMDPTHGHPLGGGHWWTEGYWRLLEGIRKQKPADRMITTECNAEPYIKWFDGYLTWNWQYDGQVPAFPAIYGGTIQMFGRAYAGGPTKDLALRMKAGQQLCFGEQIGWMSPDLAMDPDNAPFLRQVILLRYALRRYFYAGEMARPPRLAAAVPTVRADWQWGGEMWVTTSQVLTGAWEIPREKRLVLLFVNVGDTPVTAPLHFDGSIYGIPAGHVRVSQNPAGPFTEEASSHFDRTLTFPPRQATALEIRW